MDGVSIATDQKARRILDGKSGGQVWYQDCYHHLHNVWFKAMEQVLTSRKLNQILKDYLEQISSEFRVKSSFSAITQAFHKGSSKNANYTKGFGKDFAHGTRKNMPREPLYHAHNLQGSCHYLYLLIVPAIYMNCLSTMEYLDEMLR